MKFKKRAKIMRVFPRRTSATPCDDMVRINEEPGLFDECEEVHISVAFEWDLPLAEKLERAWRHIATVKVGGPATGARGEAFEPGLYLKTGYTITSRGCPNKCWFCSVPEREGTIRELPIRPGWNVLDDNLLACSRLHIENVFAMLRLQDKRPQFTGGFEAARFKLWHAEALREIRTEQVFFAYDSLDDLAPLREAGRTMVKAGFPPTSHIMRCYVLCGWPRDTTGQAETRMRETLSAGFTPMAMAWRDKRGKRTAEWAAFQRQWARPAIIHAKERRGSASSSNGKNDIVRSARND
ncbi:MAG: hypothetical protein GY820_39880 [Gammaproteobacteria bacterium]|nr:hypothetical protein [Gammaproteobacteria bacterium]